MERLGLSHVVYAPGPYTSQTHPGGLQSFTDDEWIDAFYRRYSFWVLRVAETLLEGAPDAGFQKDPDSGFAALLILFSYFEMIARHRAGRKVSRGFEKGLSKVFGKEQLGDTPAIRKEVADWLWDNMRNELAHNAFTGKGIAISGGYTVPIVWDLDQDGHVSGVGINPHLWAKLIRKDFERYVATLHDPANTKERKKFLKYATRYVNTSAPKKLNSTGTPIPPALIVLVTAVTAVVIVLLVVLRLVL